MTYPTRKLGEVCNVVIGGTPRRGISRYWDNGTLPWVSIADLSRNGREISETKEKITEIGAKESNVKLLKRGTLLFSFKLSIGKVAFAGADLYTNEAIAGLCIKSEKELDKEYLFYFLQQLDFSGAQKAVKGATLNKTKINNLEIPVPPLAEQKKIVARLEKQLGKVKEMQKLRAESLAATEQILPAALHEIFESGKQKGWDEKELSNLSKSVQYGYTAAASQGGNAQLLRITDIQNNLVNWCSVPLCQCDNIDKYKLFDGDIVFARTGATVGKSFLIKNPPNNAIFASYLIRVIIDQKSCLSEYLYYFFQSPDYWRQVVGHAVGGAQPNVNGTKLKSLKIPLPSLTEQKKIVKKLDALSTKVAKLRELQLAQQADLKLLEHAILREAFVGSE